MKQRAVMHLINNCLFIVPPFLKQVAQIDEVAVLPHRGVKLLTARAPRQEFRRHRSSI